MIIYKKKNNFLMRRIGFSLTTVLVTVLITFTHAVAQDVPFYWEYIKFNQIQLSESLSDKVLDLRNSGTPITADKVNSRTFEIVENQQIKLQKKLEIQTNFSQKVINNTRSNWQIVNFFGKIINFLFWMVIIILLVPLAIMLSLVILMDVVQIVWFIIQYICMVIIFVMMVIGKVVSK
jgi:hypothetical protein